MRLRNALRALPFVLASLSLAPLAAADPTAADRETARTLVETGDKKAQAHDFAGALKAYQTAHSIMGVPTTGVEVAKMQEALGLLVEARDTALAVTRIPQKAGEPSVFADARTQADALAARVGPKIPSLVVNVTAPVGVDTKVEVDGAAVPTALFGQPRKINPGSHHVVATAPGFPAATVDVVVKEGETKETTLVVKAGGAPPVVAGPVPVAVGPAAPPPAPTPTPPPDAPTGSSGKSYTLAIVGFTAAGVGVGLGTVTGIISLSAASSAKVGCKNDICPAGNLSDSNKSMTFAAVSDIGFGVGLAGAVVGVIGLVTAKPKSPAATQTGTSVVVSPNSVSLVGRF